VLLALVVFAAAAHLVASVGLFERHLAFELQGAAAVIEHVVLVVPHFRRVKCLLLLQCRSASLVRLALIIVLIIA